jgi:hypothetical protein
MTHHDLPIMEQYLPLTRACSLIESDNIKAIGEICQEYLTREVDHDLKLLGVPKGIQYKSCLVSSTLSAAMALLDPLTVPPTRHLLIRAQGRWTAYFDNQVGMESHPDLAREVSDRLKTRAVTLVRQPETIQTKSHVTRGFFGVVRFTVQKNGKMVRSVDCYNGDDGWEFCQEGKPFRFEAVTQYRAKKKKERFTVEMLDSYSAHWGLRPFDDSFYRIGRTTPGMLIERVDKIEVLRERIVRRPLKQIREMTWKEQ